MLDLMPKISEKKEQIGGLENYIKKYGKTEIQYFAREEKPHEIDYSIVIEKLCQKYNMKEITVHPPLSNYEIEVILMYNEEIIKKQLYQLIELSEKFNININLIFHTHWNIILHKINTVDKINKLLKIIEGKRVKILVENLFMMSEKRDECSALELCKEVNHPNFKMCLDICHFYCQANMYRENINSWLEKKLKIEECEKYVYQIHFSYTANNDGYKDKKTHGVGHPNMESLLEDYYILKKYGLNKKQIVTEISETDYSYRKSQIQDLEWLDSIDNV